MQYLGQNLIQLLIEIDVMRFRQPYASMPQEMHTVIKAKGVPTKYYSVQLFWRGRFSDNNQENRES